MKTKMFLLASSLLLLSPATFAANENVTATCKDGSSYSGKSKHGACSKHGGVKEWGTATPVSSTSSQPTGGGQVWVNTQDKVYHCPGTQWYGKTKQGEYMSETQARTQGFRADHNKACK